MKKFMFLIAFVACATFVAACGDDAGQECGEGTSVVDGQCVPDNTMTTVCGAGTTLVGTECVPDNVLPPIECGPNTTEVDGVCEPNEACGPGTTADAMGQCVPDSTIVCGMGTIDDGMGNCVVEFPLVCGDGSIDDGMGNCIIDPDRIVTCDADLVLLNGTCVTENVALVDSMPMLGVENDDWRYQDAMGMPLGTANVFTLPMQGDNIVLQGVIDTPVDLNGDDALDQDFDWYEFTATAGTVLNIRVVNDGQPAPLFVVLAKDDMNEWVGRQSATNQSNAPRRQIVIPSDGEYYIAMLDAGYVQGDGFFTVDTLVGSPDYGYFIIVENLGPLTAMAAMAPDTIMGDINETVANARTLTPSAQNEAFALATSALDPAYGGVLMVMNDMNVMTNELNLNTDVLLPIPVPMNGSTLVPSFVSADGYGATSDVQIVLDPILPSVLPINNTTETIDNGGSEFYATSVPANSLLTVDFALTNADPTASDLQALVVIYNSDLEIIADGQTTDTEGTVSLGYFFPTAQDVLIRVIDTVEEDPVGLDYGFSISADIVGVTLLGPLDAMTTTAMGATGSISSATNAWVGVEITPTGVQSLDFTFTPVSGTETIDVNSYTLIDGEFLAANNYTGGTNAAPINDAPIVTAAGYMLFEVVVTTAGMTDVDVALDLQTVVTVTGTSTPAGAITNATPLQDVITTTGTCLVADITVDVDITHSWRGDIGMDLTSPSGTTLRLHDETGGGAADLIGTYPTTLTPTDDLSGFVGDNGVGDWTLDITDADPLDDGTLNSWTVTVICQ